MGNINRFGVVEKVVVRNRRGWTSATRKLAIELARLDMEVSHG